ncbi:NAD(P)/FAD-dependent oxidoreductase [Candidatus Parcubacteria bacterium]|jgi:all-trans-retinol 13,14-reductase|nr:NAD(P)/FAD-dependent oxidoreductase [Candidatus Parcubacteria bacterium]MBT3949188.1 NAD(P)/FAD-dependent oxidoreductase [Candidatus Parcubacteria bacterium]
MEEDLENSEVTKSYTSFKKEQEQGEKTFDAIVIGSGTGGLSVAAVLAKEGKLVLVLEQHYIIGGYTHAFQRKGYMWDVGLHYVGQVHIEGTLLNKAFRYISDEKLEWEPLDNIYDRAVFGDKEYEFPRGRNNLKAKLKEYFPDEKDISSIDSYFQLLDEVNKVGPGYYIEKVMPEFLATIFGDFLRRKVLKFSDQTTLGVLKGITDNEQLIGVLTAQYGDYGLQPAQSSFYMHAVLANHYMEGAGYPVGGAPRFAETVIPVIKKAGGEVVMQASVKQIIVKNNTAIGVEMADGTVLNAKTIVSSAGVVNTYGKLLSQEVKEQHDLEKKLEQLTPSLAHMGLYVGIKESSKNLKLPKCNYWIFPDEYNHKLNQDRYTDFDSQLPVAFASFPSAKDPESEEKYPGRTMAEVIILLPDTWFAKWENTSWKKRGEEYEKLKEKFAEQMFEQLYRIAPQLKGKVDYYEVSSPLSTKHFSGHPHGEIYGAALTPKRFRQKFLKPITPVKNLYLAGQDAMIASISGGVMGGVLCATAILKKNMLWKIQKSIKK